MKILLFSLLLCALFSSTLAAEATETHQAPWLAQQAHEHRMDTQEAIDNLHQRLTVLFKSYDRKRQDVNELYDWDKFQDKELKELVFVISLLPYRIKTRVMEFVEHNGIHLGSRWKIYEQGLDGSLLFRDMISTAAGHDSRYHFARKHHVDL